MIKGKKKSVIIIVVILIISLIAIYNIITISNKPKTTVDDFRNLKELSEYHGCKYIETKKSNEEGYKKDIFLEFGIPPVTKEGGSNQKKYEEIISVISAKMNSKNYRIIDERNNIVITANFLENGKVFYIINNDKNFFEHLVSKYSIENAKDRSEANFEINSSILLALINNNWRTTNLNLGTIDSEIDKYDIYFDEGYKIRKINGRVYNIVFTNKYNESVLNNIHTNDNFEQVRNILGNETYESQMENESIIGYKNDKMYVFFSNEGISIYPNESGKDSEKFAEIVTNLIATNDQNDFLSKLTDIWPDYCKYSKTENGVIIEYPLKGIKIDFTNGQKAKIIIYENYKGNITNELSIDDVKENMNMPSTYINLKLDENMLVSTENTRIAMLNRRRNPYNNAATIITSNYIVYLDKHQNTCNFYSRDGLNIDSYIEVAGLDNIYKLTDTLFVYSISGKGIYTYDAINRIKTDLVLGNENYNIKGIDNNIIYYDDTKIKVNI